MDTLTDLHFSTAVLLHLGTVALSIVVGPVAIYRKRRDRMHKGAGYIWVISMTGVALSALALPAGVGPNIFGFGIIHLLCIAVLASLVFGVRAAIQKQISKHRAIMTSLYWQSLGIAGLFALAPGRALNVMLFGGSETAGRVAITLGGAMILWALWPSLSRAVHMRRAKGEN